MTAATQRNHERASSPPPPPRHRHCAPPPQCASGAASPRQRARAAAWELKAARRAARPERGGEAPPAGGRPRAPPRLPASPPPPRRGLARQGGEAAGASRGKRWSLLARPPGEPPQLQRGERWRRQKSHDFGSIRLWQLLALWRKRRPGAAGSGLAEAGLLESKGYCFPCQHLVHSRGASPFAFAVFCVAAATLEVPARSAAGAQQVA